MSESPQSPINLTPNGGEPTDLGLLPKPATVYPPPTVILGGTGELATKPARVKKPRKGEKKGRMGKGREDFMDFILRYYEILIFYVARKSLTNRITRN
jgi:hypothetical protein